MNDVERNKNIWFESESEENNHAKENSSKKKNVKYLKQLIDHLPMTTISQEVYLEFVQVTKQETRKPINATITNEALIV